MCERHAKGGPLYFPQHASTDKSIRDASSLAETKLEELDVEMRYLCISYEYVRVTILMQIPL